MPMCVAPTQIARDSHSHYLTTYGYFNQLLQLIIIDVHRLDFRFYRFARIALAAVSLSFFYTGYASANEQKMQQLMETRYGNRGIDVLTAWQTLLRSLSSKDQQLQIEAVNNFFNEHIRHTEDMVLWKKIDYWATPLEALGMGAGDCEDYTIAKYLTLLRLGISPKQLRLIYVKAQIAGDTDESYQAHMVLGYYPTTDAVPLILDNLLTKITPASHRADLHPVFSFNSDGFELDDKHALKDPTAKLSRWRDVLNRAHAEGIIY